jgi:hypothetical protein
MMGILSGCVVLLCSVRWEILRQGKKKEVRGRGVGLSDEENELKRARFNKSLCYHMDIQVVSVAVLLARHGCPILSPSGLSRTVVC